MAAELTDIPLLRNPLRCSGLSLPTEGVFLARLMALALLCAGHLPNRRHLPYFEFLDALGPSVVYDALLRTVAIVGFVLLFLSPWVRSACAMLGTCYLIGLLGCRSCLSVAHTYAACVFLVLSLSTRESGLRFLRWQVVILYAGAFTNKALDPDWWNGHYFETLLVERHALPLYIELASHFPPLLLSKWMGASVVLTQLTLTVCFMVRRWWPVAIVIGVVDHTAMSLVLGTTFGPFLFATLGSYLAFRRWPERVDVEFPSSWKRARWERRLQRLDFDGLLRFSDGCGPRLAVSVEGRTHRGFQAIRTLALYTPVFFFLCVPILISRPPTSSIFLAVLLLFFSPFWACIPKRV